jgi:hypothetical protein
MSAAALTFLFREKDGRIDATFLPPYTDDTAQDVEKELHECDSLVLGTLVIERTEQNAAMFDLVTALTNVGSTISSDNDFNDFLEELAGKAYELGIRPAD